jgi:hypothetical protein
MAALTDSIALFSGPSTARICDEASAATRSERRETICGSFYAGSYRSAVRPFQTSLCLHPYRKPVHLLLVFSQCPKQGQRRNRQPRGRPPHRHSRRTFSTTVLPSSVRPQIPVTRPSSRRFRLRRTARKLRLIHHQYPIPDNPFARAASQPARRAPS